MEPFKIIENLLSCIEEHVAANGGFANLGEAEAYKNGCILTGHHAPDFIRKYYDLIGEDRFEDPYIQGLPAPDNNTGL